MAIFRNCSVLSLFQPCCRSFHSVLVFCRLQTALQGLSPDLPLSTPRPQPPLTPVRLPARHVRRRRLSSCEMLPAARTFCKPRGLSSLPSAFPMKVSVQGIWLSASRCSRAPQFCSTVTVLSPSCAKQPQHISFCPCCGLGLRRSSASSSAHSGAPTATRRGNATRARGEVKVQTRTSSELRVVVTML